MRAKVPAALTAILQNRIYISRQLKIFSLEDVAQNWQITSRTLFRYDSPQDRKLSRLSAKEYRDKNIKWPSNPSYKGIGRPRAEDYSDIKRCLTCLAALEGHKRCLDCTMLIHGKPECSCSNCIVIQDSSSLILHLLQ